jgi:UDP-N-acetylmuramyl pentapeptide phosphotransferase/UDP-N-acetylglucosamine-1-phosphate transferase
MYLSRNNTKPNPEMKKAIIPTLAGMSVILFGILAYAVVYADHESPFWKHRLVIGLLFIVFTRFFMMAARHSRKAH